MSERLIPLADAAAWRGALAGLPHAFAHTWESCRAMALTSGWTTWLYACEEAGVRIVCPLAERTDGGEDAVDAVTPYGFSGFVGEGDLPGLPERWRAFAAARGWVCGYIGMNPLLQNPAHFDPRDAQAGNEVFVLDLTVPEEELFARLAESRQWEVRRFARDAPDGGRFVFERGRLYDFFLAQHAEFFRRRAASPVYSFARETLDLLFELDDLFVAGVAGAGGAIEAVSVFAHTAYVADFLFNISLPEGRRHSTPLLWLAVRHYLAAGVPALCLGGGIRPGDGVARFKERFGGRRLPLVGLKQIYRPEEYARLCRRAGVDPDPRAGYFPPYRDPRRHAAPAVLQGERHVHQVRPLL